MKTKELITKDDLKLVEKETSQAQKALVINSDDDAEKSAEILIGLKIQVDTLEDKRKEYVQPAMETVNRINADFKKLTVPRNDAISLLKTKIVEYVSGRYAEVKSKEKELQKELKTRALVLDNGLNKLVTSIGEIRFRKTYDVKVTNKNIVPEQFFTIDMKKVEAALDAGEQIPGIKVKENPIGVAAVYKSKE